MDVWWLWLNPPHSNMGFQWVIHGLTFLLISKQPQDALNLVHMTKSSAGDFGSTAVFFFTSCCCFCIAEELVGRFALV